jgi:hypothetical protein
MGQDFFQQAISEIRVLSHPLGEHQGGHDGAECLFRDTGLLKNSLEAFPQVGGNHAYRSMDLRGTIGLFP